MLAKADILTTFSADTDEEKSAFPDVASSCMTFNSTTKATPTTAPQAMATGYYGDWRTDGQYILHCFDLANPHASCQKCDFYARGQKTTQLNRSSSTLSRIGAT